MAEKVLTKVELAGLLIGITLLLSATTPASAAPQLEGTAARGRALPGDDTAGKVTLGYALLCRDIYKGAGLHGSQRNQ